MMRCCHANRLLYNHVMLTEETTERMERLKYNGKEAVGYEEKGNIQQRAAE